MLEAASRVEWGDAHDEATAAPLANKYEEHGLAAALGGGENIHLGCALCLVTSVCDEQVLVVGLQECNLETESLGLELAAVEVGGGADWAA